MCERYTDEQMDRAISMAYERAVKYGSVNNAEIKAEISKPRLRDDLPVLYDYLGDTHVAMARFDFAEGVTNVRPLIETERAKRILNEVLDEATCLGSERVDAALVERFAAYCQESPDE